MPKLAGRQYAGVVYDSARAECVLFGGWTNRYGGQRMLADTWVSNGLQWQRRTPLHRPSPRAFPACCFDAARGRVVLFGGLYGLRDTWEWDGFDWTERLPTTVPQVRDAGVLAYDPIRSRSVLLAPAAVGIGSVTWEWDGIDWLQRTSLSMPRCPRGAMMAFEPVLGRVLLHGGVGANGLPQETWDWDGAQWTLRTATGPALDGTNIAWDPGTQRMVLVYGPGFFTLGGQMWAYDRQNWVQLAPTQAPYRDGTWPVTDTARGRVLLFGGADDQVERSDTWEWDGQQWARTIPDQVPPIAQPGLAYAPGLDRIVVAGGGAASMFTFVGDESQWLDATGSNGPSARNMPLLASDWRTGGVLLFGGYPLGGGAARTDTWRWSGAGWQQVAPVHSPSASSMLFAMAADPSTGNVLAVGATETWEWDGSDWLQRSAHGTLRVGGLAFDSDRSRYVLLGDAFAGVVQTWEWDGVAWSLRRPVHQPPSRFGQGMTYDAARRRVVLHGGDTGQFGLGDTWEWDGTDWSQRVTWTGFDVAPFGLVALCYRPTTSAVLSVGVGRVQELWRYLPDHPATVVLIGSGCAGSAGIPQ
ncbi:MAG: hypothetical protein ABL997_16655, partial [Planctomycetota bacterium]